MKRVRRKEAIGNKRQYLTRSKKKKQDEKDTLSAIPLDLKVEILLKLPAKSIAKLVFVSKLWSSIIRGKDFTDLYMARSLTRPRLFFTVYDRGMQFFYTCSQEDPSSSDYLRVSSTPKPDHCYQFSPPIRGLICCENGTKVLIGNPSTGQFVTLPMRRF